MAYKNNFIHDINKGLITKRFDGDIQTTLNIPEHKFKKIAEKFNHVLKDVYDKNFDKDVKMFHILLSLQDYFDMKWLVDNVLSGSNREIVTVEMKSEFNLKVNFNDQVEEDEQEED